VESTKVLWTAAGERHVSVVSYDRPSAENRMEELRAQGATDITTVTVKPGETVAVEQPRTGRVVQRKHTVKRAN
jgi:hypothetical protein